MGNIQFKTLESLVGGLRTIEADAESVIEEYARRDESDRQQFGEGSRLRQALENNAQSRKTALQMEQEKYAAAFNTLAKYITDNPLSLGLKEIQIGEDDKALYGLVITPIQHQEKGGARAFKVLGDISAQVICTLYLMQNEEVKSKAMANFSLTDFIEGRSVGDLHLGVKGKVGDYWNPEIKVGWKRLDRRGKVKPFYRTPDKDQQKQAKDLLDRLSPYIK